MKKTVIDLGVKQYPVFIGENILKDLKDHLTSIFLGKKILVVSDENIWDLFAHQVVGPLQEKFEVHFFLTNGGKENKTFFTALEIFKVLEEKNFSRDSLIIAFGGGVVGDIAGFVSSCWYRGSNLIHIPTTMLSMVDSCLGGKTAINFRETINAIGSYHHPEAIFIDTSIIRSLPRRELSSGLGEVIKYGLISDQEILRKVESYSAGYLNNNEILSNLVEMSLKIKASFVYGDIREQNKRLFLNFGHTFGHALEMSTVFRGTELLRHGEGVGLGILAILHISEILLGLDHAIVKRVRDLMLSVDLPTKFQATNVDMSKNQLIEKCTSLILKDKKRQGNILRLILLKEIGTCEIFSTEDIDLLEKGFAYVVE